MLTLLVGVCMILVYLYIEHVGGQIEKICHTMVMYD